MTNKYVKIFSVEVFYFISFFLSEKKCLMRFWFQGRIEKGRNFPELFGSEQLVALKTFPNSEVLRRT